MTSIPARLAATPDTEGGQSMIRAPAPGESVGHLDRRGLAFGIALRREQMMEIEHNLVAACEAAAARGAPLGIKIFDRETWDEPMWKRYLEAAARLEPDYGPKIRQLVREIAQLQRLLDLITDISACSGHRLGR